MEEVFAGKYCITQSELYARISQCVAVGVKSKQNGLAHMHYNTKLNMLEEFLEEAFNGGIISICGGVDAFVPQLGFISGRKNADRVLESICKKGLEKYIKEMDIYTDQIREMYILNSSIQIFRKNIY